MSKPDAIEFTDYLAKWAKDDAKGKEYTAKQIREKFPQVSSTELQARIDLDAARWEVSTVYHWVRQAVSAKNLNSGEGLVILSRSFRKAADIMEKNTHRMIRDRQIIESEMKKRRK